MKSEIENPYNDGRCFYCGDKNESGLKLKFFLNAETGEVSTEYVPLPPYIGQGKILHGGIMIGLLDEIMGWTCFTATGEMAVTSELQVKFIRPVYLGVPVMATCKVKYQDGHKVFMDATLTSSKGVLCSVATGVYHILAKEKFDALVQGK